MKKTGLFLKFVSVGFVLLMLAGCAVQSVPPENGGNYAEETAVVLRFYFDVTEANPTGLYADFDYFEVTVQGEDWLEQALVLMNQNTRFDIGGIWYEGTRLYADLDTDFSAGDTWQALQGSTGAWINFNTLLLNLAGFPDVEEIVILMNGERDMSGDHFSFEGVFVVTGSHAAEIRERIQQNTLMVSPHIAEYRRITPQEAAELMSGDAIILDVRSLAEFDSGHIEGAVLLPHTDIAEYAEAVLPDREQVILVYCQAGRRSETAARLLVEMGYTNVFDFGGIADWHGEIVR